MTMNNVNASSDDTDTDTATCTPLDVLNGRGQKVQSHPGNVKYRTLVFVNKVSHQTSQSQEDAKLPIRAKSGDCALVLVFLRLLTNQRRLQHEHETPRLRV